MIYIGIDPGVTGAVAAIDHKNRVLSLQDTPTILCQTGKSKRHEYAEPHMASLLEGIVNSEPGTQHCPQCTAAWSRTPLTVKSSGERVCAHCGHAEPLQLLVALENVHSMPKQGVASSFSFGVGFGIWRGVLAALRLPYTRVDPAKWKRVMGLNNEKGKAVRKALQLFPRAELGHQFRGRTIYADGRAEALLLAHYAARELQPAPGKARSKTL